LAETNLLISLFLSRYSICQLKENEEGVSRRWDQEYKCATQEKPDSNSAPWLKKKSTSAIGLSSPGRLAKPVLAAVNKKAATFWVTAFTMLTVALFVEV
jgi:hypothetical protein